MSDDETPHPYETPHPSILVIIPPPVWALLFMLGAWWIGRALGLAAPFHIPFIGWPLLVIGFIVSASGRFAFARAGTEVIPVSRKNSALVTSGPFQYTRNPMYLGIVIILTGIAFLIGTIPALAAVIIFFLFVNFISIPFEEEKMERQYGDEYRAYKRRVRRWV